LPILGNILDIDAGHPTDSFIGFAREYGPIFKISTPAGTRVMVSGVDLVSEICDETRFDKLVSGGLRNLRGGAIGAGLFTSDTDDPLWARAHNILMTPFSMQSMRDYMITSSEAPRRRRSSKCTP
jgi:cytochrome P450/NADPH-cytochrome P450 reductase